MNKDFDIGIITYFFPPVNNPRSQRAYELALEFASRGYRTAVIIPDLNQNITEKTNFEIIKVRPGYNKNSKEIILARNEIKKNKTDSSINKKKEGLIKKTKNYIVKLLYPGAFDFEFSKTCPEDLIKNGYHFKHVISIGLPVCSHFAAAGFYKTTNKKPKTMIADYGDPYSFNLSIHPPYIHRFIEKIMLKSFDYITVPVKEAIESYLFFKEGDKIKIIPQGLNIGKLKPNTSSTEKTDNTIRFLYAGTFYPKIRDPFEIIEFLKKSKVNYHFTVLTQPDDPSINQIMQHLHEIDPEKITISGFLPRREAIELMSKQDFLINISNTTKNQVPSKLIDYKIADRPVFSYQPEKFNPSDFEKFLHKDYSADYVKKIDLNEFDIKNVTDRFEALLTSAK